MRLPCPLPPTRLTLRYKDGYIVYMKTTIDIPDGLYRRVKSKSAMEGLPVREVVIGLVSAWLDESAATRSNSECPPAVVVKEPPPSWFGSLRTYAPNANGRFDMTTVRRSIARGRQRGETDP